MIKLDRIDPTCGAQLRMPIDEIKVNRQCQFGACYYDMAYNLEGVDLCFYHGRQQLEAKCQEDLKTATSASSSESSQDSFLFPR